jgi:hypothetical protein
MHFRSRRLYQSKRVQICDEKEDYAPSWVTKFNENALFGAVLSMELCAGVLSVDLPVGHNVLVS